MAKSRTPTNGSSSHAPTRKLPSAATPLTHQHGHEIQPFGTLIDMPIGLEASARKASVDALNPILADLRTLLELYKKHHWQVAGHTFYQLHLLFDKHAEELDGLVDLCAERIQLLGGIALAMGGDIAKVTRIPAPPRGREGVPVQLSRLLEAHEITIRAVREAAELADEHGDDGTNDLLVSQILRALELQVWFVAEHAVDVPLVRSED